MPGGLTDTPQQPHQLSSRSHGRLPANPRSLDTRAGGPRNSRCPTCSQPLEAESSTLANVSADIRAVACQMVTKTDLRTLSGDLHTAIHFEVAALKSEITVHGGRLQKLEETVRDTVEKAGTNTTVTTRQGNMLLALRRQTEDLDNRGRRSNIRVRGLPEPSTEEDMEATLKALFREILGADMPDNLAFDRAHRANRPRLADNIPRDIICCLHHYKHKESIMLKARSRPLWRFRGADVALFQDLSPLTLNARRAPITSPINGGSLLLYLQDTRMTECPCAGRRSAWDFCTAWAYHPLK
ncbi:Hypothetical predicted protein [Pelobates cultripes]|uniref:Uncharacterized protein n=1 Tax=Pelobates cultripes TaxID=61616 RepID=A0AAD1VP52_PELCU|nr:Hypothetical predicted protein [Pelobates cultripes]